MDYGCVRALTQVLAAPGATAAISSAIGAGATKTISMSGNTGAEPRDMPRALLGVVTDEWGLKMIAECCKTVCQQSLQQFLPTASATDSCQQVLASRLIDKHGVAQLSC